MLALLGQVQTASQGLLDCIGQLWLTTSGKLSKDWTADERNEASIMFAGFSNVIDENYSDDSGEEKVLTRSPPPLTHSLTHLLTHRHTP